VRPSTVATGCASNQARISSADRPLSYAIGRLRLGHASAERDGGSRRRLTPNPSCAMARRAGRRAEAIDDDVCLGPMRRQRLLPGRTHVSCTATDAAGNRSSCGFDVFVQRKVRTR
jgi:hypothetical protein